MLHLLHWVMKRWNLCAKRTVFTFCVRHSRGRMCVLIMAVRLSLAAFPHYCMLLDVTLRNGRGCPLIVHYWADLHLMSGFHCYGSTHMCTVLQTKLKCKMHNWLTLMLFGQLSVKFTLSQSPCSQLWVKFNKSWQWKQKVSECLYLLY